MVALGTFETMVLVFSCEALQSHLHRKHNICHPLLTCSLRIYLLPGSKAAFDSVFPVAALFYLRYNNNISREARLRAHVGQQ